MTGRLYSASSVLHGTALEKRMSAIELLFHAGAGQYLAVKMVGIAHAFGILDAFESAVRISASDPAALAELFTQQDHRDYLRALASHDTYGLVSGRDGDSWASKLYNALTPGGAWR